MADLFDTLASQEPTSAPTAPTPTGDIFDTVTKQSSAQKQGPGDIFSQVANQPKDIFSQVAQDSKQQVLGPTAAQQPGEDPNAPWYSKAWTWANTPLVDAQSVKNWTGWEPTSGIGKGLEDLALGFTSPLSIALTIGTFGSGSLFESGGAALLRETVGMGAAEIGDVANGAKEISKAVKAGKTFSEGLEAAKAAGVNVENTVKGLNALKDAGLSADSLLNPSIIHRAGSSLLRLGGTGIAKAENIAHGVQTLVDAGFTIQNAYGAVLLSPKVFDALKEGDYENAERYAVNALGSGVFGYLGTRSFMREAGGMMEDAAVRTGLRVKPSEENLKLQNEFGVYDRDVTSAGRAEQLWEEGLRKKYPKTSPQDLHRVMKWVQAGMDEGVMRQRYNLIMEAGGIEEDPAVLKNIAALPEANLREEHLEPLTSKGNRDLVQASHRYNLGRGADPLERRILDTDPRAPEIADAYEEMDHDPNNPAVRWSYNALKRDVRSQFEYATKDLGIKFEGVEKDPYKNSAEMMADVRDNHRLRFLKTAEGTMPEDHPLAGKDPETGLKYNDMFRAVHDLFGHATEGFEFGPKGEENAWNQHRQMFSREAIPALTTETKGQNSWVNTGSHLRTAEGSVPKRGEPGFVAPQDRPFAQQKAGLLPPEYWSREEDQPNFLAAKRPFPTEEELIERYGKADGVKDAGFIFPSGNMVKLSGEHDYMLGYKPTDNAREEYITRTGAVRARFRTGRGGQEIVFSIPATGITEDQAARIKSAAKSVPNGTVTIETVGPEPESTQIYNPSVREIDNALSKYGDKDWTLDAERLVKATGGVTWNPRTGRVDNGFAVEVLPEFRRTLDHKAAAADIREFYQDHKGIFEAFPRLSIGAFENEISVSATSASREAAEAVARRLDQRSIADLSQVPENKFPPDSAFIDTGGHGERLAFPDYPLNTRLADLREGEPAYLTAKRGPRGATVGLLSKPIQLEKPTVESIGKALQEFTVGKSKLNVLDLASDEPGELVGRALKLGLAELTHQLAEENSGKDWYSTDIRTMFDEMSKLHPELQNNPKRQSFFTGLAAAASLGNDSPATMKLADEIYALYKETGKVPVTRPNGEDWGGAHSNANRAVLGNFQKIIDHNDGDIEKAVDWMREKHPVSELRDVKQGEVRGKAEDTKYGAYALSPKAGAFFLNMNGVETELTMDKWATRTWNRWMGTLIDRNGMVNEAPTEAQRRVATEAFNQLRKKIGGLTVAETQAVMWYYEQSLWKAHGLDIDQGVSYGTAAKYYVAEKIQSDRVGRYSQDLRDAGEAAQSQGLSEGRGRGPERVPSGDLTGEEEGDVSFNPEDFGTEQEPATVASRRAPGFYSQAERVVEQKVPNAAPGDTVLNTLRNAGVKKEELEWSGLPEFLAGKAKVSKQEVLDHLRENNVQVDEVTKGGAGVALKQKEESLRRQLEKSVVSHPEVKESLAARKAAEDALTPLITQADDLGYDSHHEALSDIANGSLSPEDIDETGVPGLRDAARVFRDAVARNRASYNTEGGFGDYFNAIRRGSMSSRDAENIPFVKQVADSDPAFMDRVREYEELTKTLRESPPSARTEFESYQLPGGENYRELLLTTPGEKGSAQKGYEDFRRDMTEKYGPNWAQRLNEEEEQYRRRITDDAREEKSQTTFKSGHFPDDPNILAHVRFNDRVDADGKKVLHLEEVQSDWHQKGRREGYDAPITPDQLRVENNRILSPDGQRTGVLPHGWDSTPEKKNEVIRDWAEEFNSHRSSGSRVADAPFKATWHELALKRMLRYAAENGYDRLSWTTGEQQTDRYDLSKRIDSLEYDRASEWLTAYKDGRKVIDTEVPREKLADTVGKDVAEKLVSAPENKGTVTGYNVFNANGDIVVETAEEARAKQLAEAKAGRYEPISNDLAKLSGVDLKVGGEGMKGFYDKIIPEFLNKYGKKWGARVGKTKIESTASGEPTESNPMGMTYHDVPAIDITQAMKDSVLGEGQPLFRKNAGPETGQDTGTAKAIRQIATTTPDELARKYPPQLVKQMLEATRQWATNVVAPASFEYVPRSEDAPGYLRVDARGRQFLGEVLGDHDWDAITILPKNVPVLLESLDAVASNLSHLSPEASARVKQLRQSVAKGFAEHPDGGVAFAPTSDRYGRTDESAVREEQFHVVQSELGKGSILKHADLKKLSQAPEMDPFRETLTEIGYDPNHPQIMALEAAAHIAVGDPGIGGTVEQRAQFFTKYLGMLAEQHGTQPLESFRGLLANEAAQIYDVLVPHLREQERVNAKLERLGSERQAANAEQHGEAGGGVQGSQNPRRAVPSGTGGAEADRGGSPSLSTEQAASLRQKAFDTPDMAQVNEIRAFLERSGESTEPPPGILNARRGQDITTTVRPEDYLRRVGADDEKSVLRTQKDIDTVNHFRKQIQSGKRVDPVEITLDHEGNVIGADGRHRALAFQQEGVGRVPVNVHRLGTPSEEVEYLRSRRTPPSIDPEKASKAMDEARVRELVEKQLVKQHYSPKELKALLDSYDWRKVTDDHRAMAKEVSDHFSETLERAQKAGALEEGVHHYVTQLWQKDASNNAAVNHLLHQSRSADFAINTSMARHRIFANAFEGELLGKKLATTDPIALAAHNRNTFERVIAARGTLDRLQSKGVRASDGRPMVSLSGTGHTVDGENGENPAVFVTPDRMRNIRIADKVVEGLKQTGDLDRLLKNEAVVKVGEDPKKQPIYAWNTHDYASIDHPAMRGWNFATNDTKNNPVLVKGELRVHPEALDYLNKRLGREQSPLQNSGIGRAMLAAGREAKGVLLFGSPFHLMQEGLRAVMTGVSPFGVEKWDLRTDPVLAKGVEKGLTLGQDYKGVESFEEGRMAGHSKVLEKIPGLSQTQSWLQSYLFEKYIPGLKTRAYRDLFARYQEAYPDWTPDKAAEVAAADVNERFGGINYRRMGRSVATQDLFRVAALAPDWLESEMRFMSRTFGEEGKVARKDVARMAVGLWAAARVLNYLTTGNAHNEAPFGVAVKDKDGKEKVYSIRTLPTDMMHAISDPGNFLAGRVAPLMRAGAEAYTGRDEYGRKIPTHNLAFSILRSTAPIPVQTAVKAATGESPEIGNADSVAKAAGLTVYPYRTEGEKKAAQIASDHSEAGPVDPAQLRRHQLKIKFEDDIRGGRMKPQDLYQMVEGGQLAPNEGRQILKNIQETEGMSPEIARFYSRVSRLQAPDMLKVWDVATNDEKAAMAKLLMRSRDKYYKKVMNDLTPQERAEDPTYLRLRRMFPGAPPF